MEINWTKVIKPKSKWFEINLKEIWEYRDLIFILVKRDILSIYKQTVLGPIWFLFGPLFTVFTYTFAFNQIAKIPTDGIPAPAFYLSGTILWNYFQACFNGASSTFNNNIHLFGKVYFPRLIPPIALIISNLLKLLVQFIVFCVFCTYYHKTNQINMNMFVLIFPVLVIIMALISLGFGLIISSLTVKYRDINQLVGVFITFLMYSTPIIYPSSSVPNIIKPYLSINPLVPVINSFRYAFTGAGAFDLFGIFYTLIFATIVFILGLVLFNRVEKTFIDTI